MRSHLSFVHAAFAAGALALAAPCAQASDIQLTALTQAEFRLLSEDLGAIVSYKPLIPSEGLGVSGFDIGVAVSGTTLHDRTVWETASGSSISSTVLVPTLRVHKGLPADVDIGVSYAKASTSNLQIVGGELRWAFVPGGVSTPAVALRGSYSSLSGVNSLSFHTLGFDLSVSKGFLFLTPYAGVGLVNVSSRPDAGGLARESFTQNKVFGGVNMSFGLLNLAFETDKTGNDASYGLKLGLRF